MKQFAIYFGILLTFPENGFYIVRLKMKLIRTLTLLTGFFGAIFCQTTPSFSAENNNGYTAPPASVGYDLSFNSLDSSFTSINTSTSSMKLGVDRHRYVTFYTEEGRPCSAPISTRYNPERIGVVRKMKLWGTCGPAPARVKDKQGRIIGIIIKSPKRFYFGPEVIMYVDPALVTNDQNSLAIVASLTSQ